MKYTCSECGEFVEQDIEFVDSGTTLICPQCNGKTIVDLWSPEQRDLWYKRAENAQDARKRLAAIRMALNFACYDESTLERCGEVWQKLCIAERDFEKEMKI